MSWLKVFKLKLRWRMMRGLKIPLSKGRALHVHLHHWSGFKLNKYLSECTCTDMWIMWFNLSFDRGTCNFDEIEKRWIDANNEGGYDDEHSSD